MCAVWYNNRCLIRRLFGESRTYAIAANIETKYKDGFDLDRLADAGRKLLLAELAGFTRRYSGG